MPRSVWQLEKRQRGKQELSWAWWVKTSLHTCYWRVLIRDTEDSFSCTIAAKEQGVRAFFIPLLSNSWRMSPDLPAEEAVARNSRWRCVNETLLECRRTFLHTLTGCRRRRRLSPDLTACGKKTQRAPWPPSHAVLKVPGQQRWDAPTCDHIPRASSTVFISWIEFIKTNSRLSPLLVSYWVCRQRWWISFNLFMNSGQQDRGFFAFGCKLLTDTKRGIKVDLWDFWIRIFFLFMFAGCLMEFIKEL